MEVIKTAIDGVFILEPRIFNDERGYFFESFSGREFEEKVCRTTFVQDNESFSTYGVLRGLHFQKPPFTQSKLVRVIKGAVLDVAVDIRKGSPTFGKHRRNRMGRPRSRHRLATSGRQGYFVRQGQETSEIERLSNGFRL